MFENRVERYSDMIMIGEKKKVLVTFVTECH